MTVGALKWVPVKKAVPVMQKWVPVMQTLFVAQPMPVVRMMTQPKSGPTKVSESRVELRMMPSPGSKKESTATASESESVMAPRMQENGPAAALLAMAPKMLGPRRINYRNQAREQQHQHHQKRCPSGSAATPADLYFHPYLFH